MKMRAVAVFLAITIALTRCASGPVEYSEKRPRQGCYQSHVGAPWEIVKVVGENPINTDEWMVYFIERHDDEMYEKPWNLPKKKVNLNCAKRSTNTDFGFRDASQSGRPPEDDNKRQ
jgi:hypothetical protein